MRLPEPGGMVMDKENIAIFDRTLCECTHLFFAGPAAKRAGYAVN
jgi:hypothetical protein